MPGIADAPTGMLAFIIATVVTASASGCYIAVDDANGSEAVSDVGTPVDPGFRVTGFGTGGTYYFGGDTGAGGGSGAGQAPVPIGPPPPATCPAVTVSRFNELMIIRPWRDERYAGQQPGGVSPMELPPATRGADRRRNRGRGRGGRRMVGRLVGADRRARVGHPGRHARPH